MSDSKLVVIGSGLAGLLTARLVAEKQEVVLLTKCTIFEANTAHSQGGIAAVWAEKDSVALHTKDTLNAGKGLSDTQAVQILAENSRDAIQQLIDLGVHFDKNGDDEFLLGLEGAHSVHRILHAGGDATGHEIQRALVQSVGEHPNIEVKEHALATEIVVKEGLVQGVRYSSLQDKTSHFIPCQQCMLATGGAGQLYRYSSNPPEATGEGVILAYQAGADLMDLEFFQFHPTGLNVEGAPNFLITEALRGEGAILRNPAGRAIMEDFPQKDLSPRDIVARSIATSMAQDGGKVYLDATHIDSHFLDERFPTIFRNCQQYGIDIRKDLIPVSPVAHYMIGGVMTDLWSRTTQPGLYACGEVTRTGVHGANRLASNSLLEAAVFAIRSVQSIQQDSKNLSSWNNPRPPIEEDRIITSGTNSVSRSSDLTVKQFQDLMWQHVGLVRNAESLETMRKALLGVPFPNPQVQSREQFELESMKVFGLLMATSALQRRESRGAHYRSDYPESLPNELYAIKRRKG